MRWKNRKLVLIDWLDSHYVPGWHTDEPSEEPLYCRSVGWLIHDGKDAKTIASHITNEETSQRSGEMTIPTKAITRMKTLSQHREIEGETDA